MEDESKHGVVWRARKEQLVLASRGRAALLARVLAHRQQACLIEN